MCELCHCVTVTACQELRTLVLDHCKPLTYDHAVALTDAGLQKLQNLVIKGTAVEAQALKTLRGDKYSLNHSCCKL